METNMPDSEFGDGVERVYFNYLPSEFSLVGRYRCQNDITAQAIVRAGSDGIGRYEIGKMLGLNTRTKAGNRRVSSSIQLLQKTLPNHVGSYQKMEGKYRMLKYFYKGDNAAPGGAFAELVEKLENLTGKKFPYGHEAMIKFPGKNLSTLRITDITLRRFLFILECLKEDDVIVTSFRLSKYIRQRENELGYAFEMDKKSLMKCLYALERKQFCRVLNVEVCDTGLPTSDALAHTTTKIQVITPFEVRSANDERVKKAVAEAVVKFKAENRLFPTNQVYYGKEVKTQMEAKRRERVEAERKIRQEAARKEAELKETTKESELEAKESPKKRRAARKTVVYVEDQEAALSDDAKEGTIDRTNCISALLPSEFELWRRKKAGVPLLSGKTLDSITNNTFRRQYNAQQTLASQSVNRKVFKTTKRQPTSLSLPIAKSPRKKTPKKKTATRRVTRSLAKRMEEENDDEDEESMLSVDGLTDQTSGGKRKFDAIDVRSQQQNMYMRSRFIAREYDMLVMIRALSFFLNPVHRFWLNPVVMRDLMHEYNPESRCKTVNSLMAASAREMVRPGRIAQMHYIVKTLGTFVTMVNIRNKVSTQQFGNVEDRDEFFKQTFHQAYKLIFNESRNAPLVSASDEEFREFMDSKKHVIREGISSSVPRRSSDPKTVDDITHCVAFNVVMSTMICEAFYSSDAEDQSRVDFRPLLNSVSPSTITDSLLVCRSEGLITRVRPLGAAVVTRSRTILSVYYRQFFNHPYRNDLIDIAKNVIKNPAPKFKSSDSTDHPLGLLCLLAATCKDMNIKMDLSKLNEVIPRPEVNKSKNEGEESLDETTKSEGRGKAIKQLRHLENSPLYLEKIGIDCPAVEDVVELPSREQIVRLIAPQFPIPEVGTAKLKQEFGKRIKKELKNGGSTEIANSICDAVNKSKHMGVTLQDIQTKIGDSIDESAISKVLDLSVESGLVFPCGVQTRRYVGLEFAEPWFVKIDGKYTAIRPWSFPNGEVNWIALRWLSEALLLTINFKPGIKISELCSLYAYVMQPICLQELIGFLEAIDCVRLRHEQRPTMKKTSPFSDERVTEVEEFAVPTAQTLNRFAQFFLDTEVTFRVVKQSQSD